MRLEVLRMNGKQARAQRHRFDPRSYQVVMVAAVEWNALEPGRCSQCQRDSAKRRSRWTGYDSGLLLHRRARPGESDNAHTDRMYREMSARQREGDFSVLAPPRAFCWECAVRTAEMLSNLGFADQASIGRAVMSMVLLHIAVGRQPFTTFCVVAEPGAEGKWRSSYVTAQGPLVPDRVYQAMRRDVDAGNVHP